MIVGCYTMHLYCVRGELCIRRDGSDATAYVGRNERECRSMARADGWEFRQGDVMCPKCRGED